MWVKRFHRRQVPESDEFLVSLEFPVGAPLIAGGDNIYSIYNALSIALVTLKGFEKVQPKKAKQLAPVADIWKKLYNELQPYCDQVEEKNSAGE